MNFRPRQKDEPEINLIPFIDVLLVVLIFLMLSTTYSKFNEMQLRLPTADGQALRDYAQELIVTINAEGRYGINKNPVNGGSPEILAAALKEAVKNLTDVQDPVVIISADATSPHQSVISVMEAARRVGLSHITFATQGNK